MAKVECPNCSTFFEAQAFKGSLAEKGVMIAAGAASGAAVGSVFPGLGTIVGTGIGITVGASKLIFSKNETKCPNCGKRFSVTG